MSKKVLRVLSFLVIAVIAFSLLNGCGKDSGSSNEVSAAIEKSTAAQTEQTPQSSQTPQASQAVYPLQGDVTIQYWLDLNANVSGTYKNLGDTPLAQELEKKTGVKVKYLHPAVGQATEALNILVASGDLPDIMEYNWAVSYPGGPEAAISNNVILRLTDAIKDYAPNLREYLDANQQVDKSVKTDNGSYYVFPFVRGDDMLLTTYGPTIRTDWLKDLGLQSPTTMDEWYAVLTAFKEKKNATAPFSYAGTGNNLSTPFNFGVFIGAYGINKDFFLNGSTVKYGPYEQGYRDFLATMATWYKDGLLDRNFATTDTKTLDANILNGLTGASAMYPGSGIGKYVPALKEKDPNAAMAPTAYPVLKKGDKPQFSSRINNYDGVSSVAISATSKNAEAAARWLDYGYSEEGNLLYNFGLEGQSYNMENGYPRMTDEVLNNPDKLPASQAWAKYARGNYSGPFVQKKEYIEQYYVLQEQKDALILWQDTDMAKHLIPPVSPTSDESAEFAKIMNDVKTLVDEYTLKIIMGNESIDSFDNYIAQLKKSNIEKAIAIKQAAYDRFTKR